MILAYIVHIITHHDFKLLLLVKHTVNYKANIREHEAVSECWNIVSNVNKCFNILTNVITFQGTYLH